jgi:7-cyano-7-deazaguanine synthase
MSPLDPHDHVLVLLSGGQDSTTCLAQAFADVDQTPARLHTVSFNYGQRHVRELDAAQRVADIYEVPPSQRYELHVPVGTFSTHTPLTGAQPLEQYASFEAMERIIGSRVEKTFVPGRNFVFLSLACALAAGNPRIARVVTGVAEADGANYPDCRELFIRAFEAALHAALGDTRLRVSAPLLHLSKADTVRLALSLPRAYYALAYSHTAYDGQYPPVGADHATVLRAEGFRQAGVPDPLFVRARLENPLFSHPVYQSDAFTRWYTPWVRERASTETGGSCKAPSAPPEFGPVTPVASALWAWAQWVTSQQGVIT